MTEATETQMTYIFTNAWDQECSRLQSFVDLRIVSRRHLPKPLKSEQFQNLKLPENPISSQKVLTFRAFGFRMFQSGSSGYRELQAVRELKGPNINERVHLQLAGQ